MNAPKRCAAFIGGLVFLLTLLSPTSTNADEWNLATVFSVNQPVEVPGQVLEPNTRYMMKLLDSPANRGIVQVFNEDRTHLYTTFFGIPKIRRDATDETVFEFMEVPAGNPLPIRAWFYPGRTTGLEFMYSKKQLEKIASYTAKPTTVELAQNVAPPIQSEFESKADENVAVENEAVAEHISEAQVTEQAVNQEPNLEEQSEVTKSESEIERSKPTEPEENVEPGQAPSSETAPPSELPRTAGGLVLYALAGALSVGFGVGVRALRK